MLLRNMRAISTGLLTFVERACPSNRISPVETWGAQLLDRPTNLEGQITTLQSADPAALRQRWRTIMRRVFPEHLPRYLIINMLAYRLQVEVLGDLSEAEKKYLAQITQKPGDPKAIPRFGDERPHQVGTVFVREHGGVVHRVVTTENGFSWHGKEYASLSAVASAITL